MPSKVSDSHQTANKKSWAAKLRYGSSIYSLGRHSTYEEALEVETRTRAAIEANPEIPVAEIVKANRPTRTRYTPELRHAEKKPYKATVKVKGVYYFLGYWQTAEQKQEACDKFREWYSYDPMSAEDWVVEIRLGSVDNPFCIGGPARNHPLVQQAMAEFRQSHPERPRTASTTNQTPDKEQC